MRINLIWNSIELLFKRFALFNNFQQSAADIVKFKMCACDWTCVLLIRIFVLSVNTFIVCEVDVITVWVCINRQVVL